MRFKGLKRDHFTSSWDEAFPIGNGTIGGLVFGNPVHETIVTNHEELFLPMPENADSYPYEGKEYLPKMRELLLDGRYGEAYEYYVRGLEKDGAPYNVIIWPNPFEVASQLHIDIEGYSDKDVTGYMQRLDFASGETTVEFELRGEKVIRKAFISRSRDIMAVEMRKDDNPFNVGISLSPSKESRFVENLSTSIEGEFLVCEATHSEEESGYVSVARVITDGICEPSSEDMLSVTKANYVLVYYTLAPWKRSIEAEKVKLVRFLKDMSPDYEAIFKEHEVIHRDLFDKVIINFSDDETEYTNDELKAMGSEDSFDPRLLERMCDYGRYLEICSFGKLPPNLQGVWNGNVTPPWSSDYTLDENVQMMMWQVLPGGLNSFARNYFDWLESYVDDFKKNAESYYGCRGIFSAPRVSSDGFLRHFHHDWPMVCWTAGAGWLGSLYEDYYEFTGDENILHRGIRYWKEVVAFYEDFLFEGKDGKLVFAPSYSPENTPLGNDTPVAVNATMDVSIAKETYKNLINACKELETENENIPRWEEEYAKLPDYTINEDGALKEWIPKEFKDDYHHRHSSHLYMVFPGHEALESGNEELYEACHKAARLRLIDGVDAISGWGLCHLANICARLKDSELWYRALSRLINVFTLDNLFSCHNEHSLFQMDANLGLTNAVYEMIAYSDTGEVRLFPVWRDDFTMDVKGLRLRGIVRILHLVKNSDSFTVSIDSFGKNNIRIVCPDGFSFENGDTEAVLHPREELNLTAFKR